jgi:hypothetical protein
MKTLYTIWTKPGETFDYLNKLNKDKTDLTLDILFVLYSLSVTVPFIAQVYHKAGDFNIYLTIIVVLLLTLVVALIIKFIFSFILWSFAKLLQGEASIKQTRIVAAYTLVPQLINLAILIVLIVIAVINNDTAIITYQNPLTQIVIWFFSARIMIIGLSRYNKYTYGSAIINILLFSGLVQGIIYGIKYLIG